MLLDAFYANLGFTLQATTNLVIYMYSRSLQRAFFIWHIYPPFTRKRIVSLYFGRDVRSRLGVAIFEMSWQHVFHIKAGVFR